MKAAKGGVYERLVCGQLSMWFSDGASDDWFWRTAGSGGRATNRRKAGKGTRGHAGDVTNTCPEGAPLIEKITFELKRGYPGASVSSMLDKPLKAKPTQMEEFIAQAVSSSKEAGTFPRWAIIHKKDRREAAILMPKNLFVGLGLEIEPVGRKLEYIRGGFTLVAIRFSDFLAYCKPSAVRKLK